MAITLQEFFCQEKKQSGTGRTLWHPSCREEYR
ncbi:Hypoticical protein [Pectobacterium parmentieri]|uniref:Hypoticical protein n=1 Tax=Pectobacterium parmentieri TaxID=1905730 RepID=A0A0H3I2P2_PECPM|nr:Hypoticical protein [Pectobacterium parmentieri]